MPLPDNEKHPRSIEQDDSDSAEQDSSVLSSDDTSVENLSEVAKRINLLGKLVVPPPSPWTWPSSFILICKVSNWAQLLTIPVSNSVDNHSWTSISGWFRSIFLHWLKSTHDPHIEYLRDRERESGHPYPNFFASGWA